jgi:hypothetical protein
MHGELCRTVGLVQELGTSVLGRSSRDTVTRGTADAGDCMAELQAVSSLNSVIHF